MSLDYGSLKLLMSLALKVYTHFEEFF